MSAEAAMPILNRLARNLSPLEENGSPRQKGASASPPVKRGSPVPLLREGEGLAEVMDIGSAVLTARLAGHPGGKEEGRWGLSGEPLAALTADLQAFWRQGQALCIEVRGQSDSGADSDMLLLEKWNMKIVSNNRPAPPGPPSSPKLLLQAVCSYLHFSQIRSWQEVGVTDHTPVPFHLLYRVCSDSSSEFSPYSQLQHVFPTAPLSPHASLLVSLEYLPRLPHFPAHLSRNSCKNPACRAAASKILSSQQVQHHVSEEYLIAEHNGAAKQSPNSSEVFPFSPPLPSPLSPKLLSGLAERTLTSSSSSPLATGGDHHMTSLETAFKKVALNSDSKQEIVNSDLKPVLGRTSECASGMVPPASCSPAPFSRLHTGRERGGLKRRSCAITIKKPASKAPPQRSNSAPVFVPSLCLLGTFEESVLNGRLEPVGHVEGFTVELGASGSFCPPHVVLPVNAAFYNLHDNHEGTSPYLGQVELSTVGKRGYQVPRKGTVQVTLFNPNYTVLKIYIVTYNFSDMPALTQTFLRQKTLSCPTVQGATPTTPALHYLIHLRFLCSKSRRVYLHRDIRLIFAHRAPDTDPDDSKVTLYTTTEGPQEPKYSPCSVAPSQH